MTNPATAPCRMLPSEAAITKSHNPPIVSTAASIAGLTPRIANHRAGLSPEAVATRRAVAGRNR